MTSTYIVADPWGNPIRFKDGSANHWYYLPDSEGSVVGMINGDGSTITDKYMYDEFGRVTFCSAGTAQPLGFAAGIADPTGLVKFGTRDYDPNLRRWTQQDPIGGTIGNPSTINAYIYAGCDPINAVDPSGQLRCPQWLKNASSAIGFGGFGRWGYNLFHDIKKASRHYPGNVGDCYSQFSGTGSLCWVRQRLLPAANRSFLLRLRKA